MQWKKNIYTIIVIWLYIEVCQYVIIEDQLYIKIFISENIFQEPVYRLLKSLLVRNHALLALTWRLIYDITI